MTRTGAVFADATPEWLLSADGPSQHARAYTGRFGVVSMFRQARLVWVPAVLTGLMLHVASAGAAVDSKPATLLPASSPVHTEITEGGSGPGESVHGFIAEASNPFEPVLEGYPASNPTMGFTPRNVAFAGIIHAMPVGGGPLLDLYCIDLTTATSTGLGYGLGTWNAANVPNEGYIARLLNEYYPNTEQPVSLTGSDEKAAAVQAAIWFFSDRYVVSTSDQVYAATVAIVNQVIAQGPLAEPAPPNLTITPSHASGSPGGVLGPFTVSSGAGQAVVAVTGANMFSDAAGTVPISDGATVPSGQQVWLRSTAGPGSAVLEATAPATVPSGNVYLYDKKSKVNEAQSLILAATATLTTTVQASAEFREIEEPEFTIEKLQEISASGGGFTKSELTGKLGQIVDYQIVVANTGNVAIVFSPLSDPNCTNISPSGVTELAVGHSETFTCEHTLTTVGKWINEAEIEGAGKHTPSNEVIVNVPEEPEFTIEKLQEISASGGGFTKSELTGKLGQIVDYQIVVANTGNVAIVFSPLSDPNCTNISPSGVTELAVGHSETFTCEHTLTTVGKWINEAEIEGAGKHKPSNEVIVNVPEEPEFTIEKLQEISASGGGFTKSELTGKLGQIVDYQIVVANTGNVAIVFSPLSDPNCTNISPSGVTELAVGHSETFTCEHTLTTVGKWINEAEIEGAGKHKPSNEVIVNVPEEPEFTIEKLQEIQGSGGGLTKSELTGELGQVVDYRVIVRNTGNVAIKFAPLIDKNCSSISPSGATEVPVGGSEEFMCEHALASSGSWTNEAAIEGAGKTKPSNEVVVNVPAPLQPVLPAQVAKAKCAISESLIVLHGVLGSKRKPFAVHISSLGIKEITFYLDGKRIKTLKSSQAKNGEFKIEINPRKLSYGAHRVSVRTQMSDSACAAIARSAVFVHPKSPAVRPRFTG